MTERHERMEEGQLLTAPTVTITTKKNRRDNAAVRLSLPFQSGCRGATRLARLWASRWAERRAAEMVVGSFWGTRMPSGGVEV